MSDGLWMVVGKWEVECVFGGGIGGNADGENVRMVELVCGEEGVRWRGRRGWNIGEERC